ncbi:glycosyl transferase [Marinomonas sp. A3A]|uniref:glycosyltransferase family 2 protein n=1 Tax=Marinomonas sp. A3A TaxID=2065312 RepID=UPI001BB30284|nr:glycosyltransferase family 2 protein [Marinomonas sp. A3A]QUX90618.1 glycosyl transferase [Marinomonas sp. A3A]
MKISVITVCYNSQEFIVSAIDSVLFQSHDDIEYIIVDGESKDNTVSIISAYKNKVDQFVSEPDKGIYDAMNKGLALATGDVIGILNSDDFYPHPDIITQVAQAFERSPNVDMVLGNVDFVKSDNLSLPMRFYSSFNFSPWKIRFGFMPAHPAAFIKRSAYEKVGSYALGYKIGADFEWFVRALLIHRLSYVKLNQTLVRMREGGVSTSGMKSYWLTSKEQIRALRDNNVYSNFVFVLSRLPIKFVHKIIKRK